MRRTLLYLLCLATLGGCVLWRRPPTAPATPPTPSPAPSPAPAPQPPVASAAECARIAELAASGKHKPAADALWPLIETGRRCPEEIESAARDSFRRLAQADALLHQAETRRAAGDLTGALESMRAALAIYPNYHRATQLLDEVERQRAAEPRGEVVTGRSAGEPGGSGEPPGPAWVAAEDELQRYRRRLFEQSLDEARAAQARDELEGAARLTLQALEVAPDQPGLKLEVIEFAERLGLALFSDGALRRAKEIWQGALELDGANAKLRSYLEQVQRRLDSLERIKRPEPG